MSDTSARLDLPYILPAQAQKHVTHNEALARLDAVVQLVLENIDQDTPPALPAEGQVWGLGENPTGEWAAHAGELAQWMNPGWAFIQPANGWRAWNATAAELVAFDGTTWGSVTGTQNLDGIGIQTSWDATNRLAVSSDATLLSHAGNGHQLKINKAGISDTASLLYQTNWTGHAEMGLAGNNGFSVKVSADGGTWHEALVFDPATGLASGDAIAASPTDTSTGKLARADYAYGPGNVVGPVTENSGTPSGAVIESGSTASGSYTKFADGLLMCTQHISSASTTHTWTYPESFSTVPVATAIVLGNAPRIATLEPTISTTQAEFSVWDTSGAAASGELMVTAIGRWF